MGSVFRGSPVGLSSPHGVGGGGGLGFGLWGEAHLSMSCSLFAVRVPLGPLKHTLKKNPQKIPNVIPVSHLIQTLARMVHCPQIPRILFTIPVILYF